MCLFPTHREQLLGAAGLTKKKQQATSKPKQGAKDQQTFDDTHDDNEVHDDDELGESIWESGWRARTAQLL